jgi:heptaprenyl diphosphate synthase
MTSIHSKQEEIFLYLHQLTGQSFLLEKLGKPSIPTLFIRVLHLMLTFGNEESARIFTYSVSTALLRMGLVVHEQVSLHEETDRGELEKRQLTILAGDYYSSLFYKALAVKGEVKGMQYLAQTASHIFEISMKHHIDGTYEPLNQEEWTSNYLLTALADFFHVKEVFVWQTILKYFLYLDHQLPNNITRESLVEIIETLEHTEVQVALHTMLQEREEVAR